VQDGRLRVNDQLVEVNGVSLSGMDNARAIQVLREAMVKDGRIKGFIGITVLRPRTSAQSLSTPGREVRVSQADNEDTTDGCVSMLSRSDPAQRLLALGESGRGISHAAADSPGVSLPADIAQVQSQA